jgi:hypothetical protein
MWLVRAAASCVMSSEAAQEGVCLNKFLTLV